MSENQGKEGNGGDAGNPVSVQSEGNKEAKKREKAGNQPITKERTRQSIHTHTYTPSQFKSRVERDIHYFSILITTTKIERIDFFFEQIHSERSFLQSLYPLFTSSFIQPSLSISLNNVIVADTV